LPSGASQGEKSVAPRGEDKDETGGNPDGRVEPCGDDCDEIANEARGLGNRCHVTDEARAEPRTLIGLKIRPLPISSMRFLMPVARLSPLIDGVCIK